MKIINNLQIHKTYYNHKSQKRVVYTCLKCGYEGETYLYTLKSGSGCPCCCVPPKIVVEHINSIVATNEWSWMAQYFKGGYNEAKLYTPKSHQKVTLVCPDCGVEQSKPKQISVLARDGFACEFCGIRKSYPERFMASLLRELNINFIEQLTSATEGWCKTKRYDFYIPSMKMIIETHGEQHYVTTSWSTVEVQEINDRIKRDMALENGILDYIVVDCRKSEFDYIRGQSIIALSKSFDLTSVNWENVKQNLEENITKQVWSLWEMSQGETNYTEIERKLSISRVTVKKIIERGVKEGIVTNYNHKDKVISERDRRIIEAGKRNAKPISVYKDGEFVATFSSARELVEKSEMLFHTKMTAPKVSTARKSGKTYKGFTFV